MSETDADREFFDEVERLADRAVTALFQRARLRRIAQLEEALREEREEPRLRLINGGGGP